MSHSDYVGAVRSLKDQTRSATQRQHDLSRLAGKKLAKRTPTLVAAAMLRAWFAEELAELVETPIPDWLDGNLAELSESAGIRPKPIPASRQEAEAWVGHIRRKIRLKALQRLLLRQGDLVQVGSRLGDDVFVVSSIGDDGCVWFLGGRGVRAWPDQLNKIVPTSAKEEADLRRQAANRSAAAKPAGFSADAARELEPFRVHRPIASVLLEELRMTVEQAKDESDIQAYLAENSELLGLLMRGPDAYVIPEPRLGAEYIPDFLMVDVDSTGPRWVLVELESPNSSVVLKTKNDFEARARTGIAQVNEWRQWIEENLAYAQRLRRDSGCGLAGIRPAADGLVIVGRRHLAHEHAGRVQRQPWEASRIAVHTYDWLLEQLEGSLAGIDSPIFNRFILSRPEAEQLDDWI